MKHSIIFLLFFCTCFIACKQKHPKKVKRDTSINKTTSFNNLFFDSNIIDEFLETDTSFAKYKEQFHNFYKERNYEFAWFDTSGLAEQTHNFYNLLNTAITELNDSSLISPKMQIAYQYFTNNYYKKAPEKKVIEAELLMTAQFFNYAEKVYKGIDMDAQELGWFIPRKKVDLNALLDSVIATKAKQNEVYLPFNSQYKKLQQQLVLFNQIQKKYPTDTIATLQKPLTTGDTINVITDIKKRLFILGDLAINDTINTIDSNFIIVIKSFQKRFGLPINNIITNKFIEALNIPIKQRIETILINLERARWLPAEKDSNYILVNIPEYKLHVFDSAINVWDMNVIVGKAATSTVIFNGNLKYIVFSPYWNIPQNIIKNEILPNIKRERNYLEKNNMEQYGIGDNLPLIRQKSGPKNSLGLVKFLFPNNFDIYFHDTPNRDLFNATNRSFSHGCIRLGEPKKMAEYLLRKDTFYNSNKIDSLMNLPKEKWVVLPKSVPVFIVYFTSWVDKKGILNFRKDIYNHDKKMSEKMFIK